MAGPFNRTDLARAFALGAYSNERQKPIFAEHTKSSSAGGALQPEARPLASVCPAKTPFGYPSFRITTLLLFHMRKTK